jgi:ABC-type sugar transport system ATPase subunit
VLDAKVSTSPLLTSARPVLSLAEVQAFYGKAQILFDLSLQVRKGHVVAIIGANGAGKSTTLNVIIGRLTPASGEARLEGSPIHGLRVEEIVARGITCVPQRRRIFATMTVRENREVGAYTRRRDKVLIRLGLEGVRTVSSAEPETERSWRLPLPRRAANDRHRAGLDVSSQDSPARRAEASRRDRVPGEVGLRSLSRLPKRHRSGFFHLG